MIMIRKMGIRFEVLKKSELLLNELIHIRR